jgi:hypothetical protein
MKESEQNFDDDNDDGNNDDENEQDNKDIVQNATEESLNMFFLYLIKKMNSSIKRELLAMFLDSMGAKDRSYPYGMGSRKIVIELSSDCKSHIEDLVDFADMILFRTLSKKQRELYNYFSTIRYLSRRETMTGNGYVELLNACNSLARLTGLPFSVEEQYGGLKDWDEWNNAIDKAIKESREKFGRKKGGRKL